MSACREFSVHIRDMDLIEVMRHIEDIWPEALMRISPCSGEPPCPHVAAELTASRLRRDDCG